MYCINDPLPHEGTQMPSALRALPKGGALNRVSFISALRPQSPQQEAEVSAANKASA